MEEVKNEVVEETKEVETTENTDTQTVEEKEEKKLSQKEVDEIVKKRLERERKNLPSDEELNKFKEWQEQQKTIEEKQKEKLEELEKYKSEKELVERENIVLKQGVKSEDTDYVVFKVSKMDGDFSENLEAFLKENPRFTQEENKVVETTGVKTGGGNVARTEDGVLKYLKAKHPDLYN